MQVYISRFFVSPPVILLLPFFGPVFKGPDDHRDEMMMMFEKIYVMV